MRAHLAIRLFPLLTTLALVTTSCAYIGQSAFEEKQNDIDEDNDGSPFGGPDKDCDDNNKEKTPGAIEIPYDGWDNDCEGGDIIDMDGDGFAPISKEAYLALTPDAKWPNDVDPDRIDCVDDLNIHANAATIFPGAPDVPYDGVDSDCAGDNDFDVDLDGYLPDTFDFGSEQGVDTRTAYDAYVLEWGLDLPAAVYGDCDDFDNGVSPGTTEEDIWYDGIDQNCDGNNDFDQDGDGFMPDRDGLETDFDDFIDRFHGGVSPFEILWDDCLDADTHAYAIPEDVYPGFAADLPYDGIDSDCSCLASGDCNEDRNDFDQDGDGVMPDSAAQPGNPNDATFDEYELAWGYDLGGPGYGDCDDTNPLVFPGALELLGDNNNQDCSTENQDAEDITPFGFGGLTWDNPRPPRVDATDLHYILATSADQVDLGGSQPVLVGAALVFDMTSAYDAPLLGTPALWQGATNAQPLGAMVSLVTTGDLFWASTSYNHSATSWTYVIARKVQYEVAQSAYIMSQLEYDGTNIQYDSLDIDLVVDSEGSPWVASCGVTTLHVMKGFNVIPNPAQTLAIGPTYPQGVPGGICFWDKTPNILVDGDFGLVTLCDPGVDCLSYDFDPATEALTPSLTQDWAGNQFLYARYRDDWLHTIGTGTGATLFGPTTSYDILQGETVLSIDADWRDTDGNTIYIAAVVDRGNIEVLLLHGDPDVSLTEIRFPFDDPARPGLIPQATSIYTDDNRLFMAVTGTNPLVDTEDAVGWVFLGWP